MELNIFSFFSGAGFLDFGFEKEQFKIVFVNEYNEEFLNAYKFARSELNMEVPSLGYYCGDINDLLSGDLKKKLNTYVNKMKKNGLVGFIGGPPCPDFSVAGKNAGILGENGSLTNSYKNIILQENPHFFLFENVKGLWVTKKHRSAYDDIKKEFQKNGYVLIDKLINALDYGVPQERERIILFGIKYDLLDSNQNEALQKLHKDFTWGENEYFNKENRNKCSWPNINQFIVNSTLSPPENIIQELSVEYWFQQNDVENHYNAKDFFRPWSIERFTSIPEGDVSKKSFKRLHRWRYSPTAAYGNNEVHLHPYHARRLSVAEALALQSLPKDYVISKTLSKSDMFKTIGNGVPFLVSKEIAHSIKIFLEAKLKKKDKK